MGVFRHSYDEDSDLAGKVEVTGRIKHTTDKALLFDDGTSQQWLPKRFVKISELKGGLVELAMPEWLAKEKRYV